LDLTSLTNSGVTFFRNADKQKTATATAHRQTDRQTAVELEQRGTENGEKSYGSGEGNSAEEYFDKKKKQTNKAREAVMQSGERKEARQVEKLREGERDSIRACSFEMNFTRR